MERPTPRADENTRPADIPRRRRDEWQPDARNERALDRLIESAYGRKYTWRRWRRE